MYLFPSWPINIESGPISTSFEKKTSNPASLLVLVSSMVMMKRQPKIIFPKDHSLSLLAWWPRHAEIAVGSLGYPKHLWRQQYSTGVALLSLLHSNSVINPAANTWSGIPQQVEFVKLSTCAQTLPETFCSPWENVLVHLQRQVLRKNLGSCWIHCRETRQWDIIRNQTSLVSWLL